MKNLTILFLLMSSLLFSQSKSKKPTITKSIDVEYKCQVIDTLSQISSSDKNVIYYKTIFKYKDSVVKHFILLVGVVDNNIFSVWLKSVDKKNIIFHCTLGNCCISQDNLRYFSESSQGYNLVFIQRNSHYIPISLSKREDDHFITENFIF